MTAMENQPVGDREQEIRRVLAELTAAGIDVRPRHLQLKVSTYRRIGGGYVFTETSRRRKGSNWA